MNWTKTIWSVLTALEVATVAAVLWFVGKALSSIP